MRLFIVACLSGMLFLVGCPEESSTPTGDDARKTMEDGKATGDAAAKDGKAGAADDAKNAIDGLGK